MEAPKKILVIRNDHIGDLILSTQVFRELKKVYPKAKISVIVSKVSKAVLEKNKNVNEILELEMPKKSLKNLIDYVKMYRKIKGEKFDCGIDLRGSLMNDIFLLWAPGIKKRIGLIDSHRSMIKRKLASKFLTNPVEVGFFTKRNHVSKENLQIINKGLVLNLKNYWPEIITDKEDEKDFTKFLRENKIKKYVCLCPISSLKYKQWDIENWRKLINWLEKYNIQVLLLGTKDEETALNELSRENKKSKVIINFNLRKMALLFKKSKLVICQDGGPMHIAWVSGARMIEVVPNWPIRIVLGKVAPLRNAKVFYAKGLDMSTIKLQDVEKEADRKLKN